VITEADADRAFYERVAITIDSATNYHFTNGQGKQSLVKAARSLTQLGVPVAVIVDLDILRTEADYTGLLSALAANIEMIKELRTDITAFRNATNLRSASERFGRLKTETTSYLQQINAELDPNQGLRQFARISDTIQKERDEWRPLKDGGIRNLDGLSRTLLEAILARASSVGLFIVPYGELEYWLVDCGLAPVRDKSQWISQALPLVARLTPDTRIGPWSFMSAVSTYLSQKV
jgi:hypothetical protein